MKEVNRLQVFQEYMDGKIEIERHPGHWCVAPDQSIHGGSANEGVPECPDHENLVKIRIRRT